MEYFRVPVIIESIMASVSAFMLFSDYASFFPCRETKRDMRITLAASHCGASWSLYIFSF